MTRSPVGERVRPFALVKAIYRPVSASVFDICVQMRVIGRGSAAQRNARECERKSARNTRRSELHNNVRPRAIRYDTRTDTRRIPAHRDAVSAPRLEIRFRDR